MENNSLTIGSTVFVVHRDYANQNKVGGSVNKAKVCSFRNVSGQVIPEFKIVGQKQIADSKFYCVFTDVNEAIETIKTK